MSELEFFFAEQQELMNLPEEDVHEYIARRRTGTRASYGFNQETLITESMRTALDPNAANSQHITPPPALQRLMGPCAQHEPHELQLETVSRQYIVSPLVQGASSANSSPNGRSSKLPTTSRASESRKRPSKESDRDQSSFKKMRTEDEVSNPAAETTSPASPATAFLESDPPIERKGPSPDDSCGHTPPAKPEERLPLESAAQHLPSNSEPQSVPAGLPGGSGKAAESPNRLIMRVPSYRPSGSLRSVGPSTSHQGEGRPSMPGLPAGAQEYAPTIPPPPSFRRRGAVADCSDITSPPNSLPSGPIPSGSRAKEPGSVYAPKNIPKRELMKTVKVKGKKTVKELITPLEYAQRLQARFSASGTGKKKQSDKPFLKGKRIFYYGGDLNYAGQQTRNRMEIITRHGGMLVPKYDPEQITHIVTDADERVFLRAIGLKKLSDIPQHIPTVKWSWILSGFDRAPIKRLAHNGKGKAPEAAGGGNGSADEYEYRMDHEFEHAAYGARIDAGWTPWGEAARLKAERAAQKQASASRVQTDVGAGRDARSAAASRSADEISNISDFTQDIEPPPAHAPAIPPLEGLSSPPSSPSHPPLQAAPQRNATDAAQITRPSSSSDRNARPPAGVGPPEDPLAEFYATARAEREAEMLQGASDSTTSAPAPPAGPLDRGRREVLKKGFVCDDKGGPQRLQACPNQDVIDKLQELKALHAVKPSKDDGWRVMGYNKAIAALRRHPTRIKSYEEAVALRGVGEKTAQKIMEIIETGDLRRIEHERTGDVEAIQGFLGIYGVGLSTAFKWYNNGCRTLEDVAARKGGIKLTTEQEIGLRYYDDINTRIPRAEVEEIYNKVKAAALKIDPKLFIEIMGSFRRGKADCGDIDVLITRPTDDGKTHQGVLRRLLKQLHQQGIVTEDLCLPDDFDELELVYRGLCRRDSNSPRRRIDFLTVPWKSRGAALLYYTGDDIFNRSLRLKANKMGYSLNQRGLYAGVVRDPRDRRQKLNEGHLIASESEREILDILGVPWQEPHERVRG